ncbi:MAG: hypothetical protein ACK4J0_02150 [Candidatus Anstonellaceae archaeon]
MFGFKKGQGASEYLILLAVVLIIGIIAVALLGGFSDIGAGAREKEARQYWAGAVRPFTIQDWAQKGTVFSLTIKNNEPYKLVITNITISNVSYAPSGGLSFAGGGVKTISISGFNACNQTTFDYFEYPVVITYSSSDISGKVQKGEKPLVGPCQVQ